MRKVDLDFLGELVSTVAGFIGNVGTVIVEVLYCIVLYCIVLCCIVLYCIVYFLKHPVFGVDQGLTA